MTRKRGWTEEELRAAVSTSSTFSALLRALGLKTGSRQYLHGQLAKHGIDVSHYKSKQRKRLCSDDELRRIAASARSLSDVLDTLGVPPVTHNFYKLKRLINELGIDITHFVRGPSTRARWNDADLRSAIVESRSYAQVIRKLGLVPAGGNYVQVQRRVLDLDLDTSHFTGMGWNKGKIFDPAPALPLEKVLVAGREVSSHRLKKRLFREGLKHEACELCGWAERSPDGRIPLELDHINGDRTDNRLENLRVLCPNCHSLQPTHRGLNQRRAKVNRS